jgi:REP element-mobilizing transposase RayT
MRSSLATGSSSFFKHAKKIEAVVQKQAATFGVTVYDFANGGNHLHLIVKCAKPALFKNFLRAVAGLIARAILRAEKGVPKLAAGKKFWDARPFTRVANWGRAYEYLKSYLVLNKLEALGFVAHQPRDRKFRKLYSVSVDEFKVTV